MSALLQCRRERAVARQRAPRRRGGARRERTTTFELERAEQCAAPQPLLRFDRMCHLGPRRIATQPLARVPRERDARSENDEPHEERHDARQRQPAGIAQHARANGDDQYRRSRSEHQPGDDFAAPDVAPLSFDQLV